MNTENTESTTYEDFTRQVGDQWVAALKQAEEAFAKSVKGLREAAPELKFPTPATPQQLVRLGESVAERLPKPSEIVEANFELTQRLLTAQRDLALSLLSTPGEDPGESDTPAKWP